MPDSNDRRLSKIAAGLELVKRLEQPAGRAEFYAHLLELVGPFNVVSIAVGVIPYECRAGEPGLCEEIGIAPFPPRVRNPDAPLGPLPLQLGTRFFTRDPGGALLCWSYDGAGAQDVWAPGKGLVFPRIADNQRAYGLCCFGPDLASDMAAKRTLSFIASYSFARLLRAQGLGAPPRLSSRQLEALQWAAEGKTNQEIAMIMGVSEYTVDKYMRQMNEALNAVNRTAAIVQAMRYGLIA